MNGTFAIFQILAFLGALALVVGLTLGATVAGAMGKRDLALKAAAADLIVLSGYAIVWVLAGVLSSDRVLSRGEEKHFCEIDCHVANSVTGVTRADSVDGIKPAGTFYLVTVRTWFDPTTTSPSRPKDAVVYPNPRVIYLVDAGGRRFAPSEAGMAALQKRGEGGTPITQPLLPDASYTTTFAFDAPANLPNLRLWLANDDVGSALLIGSERSPMHGKVLFAL